MPGFSMQVSHELGQQQAAEKLKGFLEKVRQRYQDQVKNLEEAWEGDTLKYAFTTYGFTIRGELNCLPEVVKIEGQLPLAAMMFKGRIEQSIRDELERVLS